MIEYIGVKHLRYLDGMILMRHIDMSSNTDLLVATTAANQWSQTIREEISQYPLSMGWNTLGAEQTNGIDSDLTILNERLIKNGLPSIVGYNSKGFPFIESHSHVDLYMVFRNTIREI